MSKRDFAIDRSICEMATDDIAKAYKYMSANDASFTANAVKGWPAALGEIDRIKTQRTSDQEKIAVLEEDNIKKGVTVYALENALEKMVFAYINKDGDCPHQFEKEALELAEFVGNEQTAKLVKSVLEAE